MTDGVYTILVIGTCNSRGFRGYPYRTRVKQALGDRVRFVGEKKGYCGGYVPEGTESLFVKYDDCRSESKSGLRTYELLGTDSHRVTSIGKWKSKFPEYDNVDLIVLELGQMEQYDGDYPERYLRIQSLLKDNYPDARILVVPMANMTRKANKAINADPVLLADHMWKDMPYDDQGAYRIHMGQKTHDIIAKRIQDIYEEHEQRNKGQQDTGSL